MQRGRIVNMPEQTSKEEPNQQLDEHVYDNIDESENLYDSSCEDFSYETDMMGMGADEPTEDIPNTWLNRLLPLAEPMAGIDWQSVFGRVFMLNDEGIFTPMEMERILAGKLSDLQRLTGLPYNVGDILQQFTTLPLSLTHHYANTGEYLRALFDERKLVDVLIHVQDKIFAAHRVALACHSVYFARVFILNQHQKHKLTEIKLKNVDAHAFFAILRFIYTGHLSVTKKNVDDLIKVANQLQIPALLFKCLDFLGHIPNKKTEEAEELDPQTVETHVKQLLRTHLLDLTQDESFLCERVEVVEMALGDDDVLIDSELDVFYAVLAWLAYNLGPRRQHAERLMRQVRFTCMTPAEMIEATQANHIIRNSPYCRNRVLEAVWLMTIKDYNTYDVFKCRCPKRRSCLEGRGPLPPDDVKTYMTHSEPVYENIREADNNYDPDVEPVDFMDPAVFPDDQMMSDPVVFKPISPGEITQTPDNKVYHPAGVEPEYPAVTMNKSHNQMRHDPSTGFLESLQEEDTSFNNPGMTDRKNPLSTSAISRISMINTANPEVRNNFCKSSSGKIQQSPGKIHQTTRDRILQPSGCEAVYTATRNYQPSLDTVYLRTAKRDHQPTAKWVSQFSNQKSCQSAATQSHQPTSEMEYYSAASSKYQSVAERGNPLVTYSASGYQHSTDVYEPFENRVPQTSTDLMQQHSGDIHYQASSSKETEQRSRHGGMNRVSPPLVSQVIRTVRKVDLSPESTNKRLVTFTGRDSGHSPKYRSGDSVSSHLPNRVLNGSSRSDNATLLKKQQSLEQVVYSNRSSSANPFDVPTNRRVSAQPSVYSRVTSNLSTLPEGRLGGPTPSVSHLSRHGGAHLSSLPVHRRGSSTRVSHVSRHGSARHSIVPTDRHGGAHPTVVPKDKRVTPHPSVVAKDIYGGAHLSEVPKDRRRGTHPSMRPKSAKFDKSDSRPTSETNAGMLPHSQRVSVTTLKKSASFSRKKLGQTDGPHTVTRTSSSAFQNIPTVWRIPPTPSSENSFVQRSRTYSTRLLQRPTDSVQTIPPHSVPSRRHFAMSVLPPSVPTPWSAISLSQTTSGQSASQHFARPSPWVHQIQPFSLPPMPSSSVSQMQLSSVPQTLPHSQPPVVPLQSSDVPFFKFYTSQFSGQDIEGEMTGVEVGFHQPVDSGRPDGVQGVRDVGNSDRALVTSATGDPQPKDPHHTIGHGRLYNGDLLVVGGFMDTNNRSGSSQAQRLDSSQQKWEKFSEMPETRINFAAAFLNGKLVVCGGYDPNFSSTGSRATRDMFRFDPADQKWERGGSMLYARSFHTVCLIEGRLFALGGLDHEDRALKTAEVYDPGADRWVLICSMAHSRIGACAAGFQRRVIVTGGYGEPADGDNTPCPVLVTTEWFETDINRWWSRGNLRLPRAQACLVAVAPYLYLCGGVTRDPYTHVLCSIPDIDQYNPNTDQWTHITDLQTARHNAGATTLGTQIYIVGGVSTDINRALRSVECYDVTSRRWNISLPELPFGAKSIACVVVSN